MTDDSFYMRGGQGESITTILIYLLIIIYISIYYYSNFHISSSKGYGGAYI